MGNFCPPGSGSALIRVAASGSGSATLVNGNASHLFLVLHEDLLQSDNLIFVRLALGLENFSKGALADFCNFLIPIAKRTC